MKVTVENKKGLNKDVKVFDWHEREVAYEIIEKGISAFEQKDS